MHQKVESVNEQASEIEVPVEIPIDKKVNDFYNHLSYNDRIVFSAKFGDGKTYFLNKFFEKYSDKYEVIRLYPVNYQVEDNKDVFELIKRDILIHLLGNDLVEDEDFFDDILYAQNYLFENGKDIILDILEVVPSVKVPTKILKQCLKHLSKYKSGKSNFKKNTTDIIEDYLNVFEKRGGTVEFDVISELIFRIIKKIQAKKKVVLVIDDLDRLDPAHLFRILNVITAHIDDRIILNESILRPTCNKFGFNKIITVFDYMNVERIFHHLYGADTNFDGYISKFSTSLPFNYSLNQIATEYVRDTLINEYFINEKILQISDLKDAFLKCSVREKLKLIQNLDDEIVPEIISKTELKISSRNSFSYLLVVLKKLNLTFVIVSNALNQINVSDVLDSFGACITLINNLVIFENELLIKDNNGDISDRLPIKIDFDGDLVKNISIERKNLKLKNGNLKQEANRIYNEMKIYIKP